jgi:hypothetical protein
VTSLYQVRRYSDIVLLGGEVYWQRCTRRGGLVTSMYQVKRLTYNDVTKPPHLIKRYH